MPQLLRLRLVSVGHRLARMDDLTLDFRDAQGRACDSTIWLRNGGGKSSILNLLFAIIRPHRNEFLGGVAEAKQRSLDDYILAGDRSVSAAEWSLDAASDTLGFEGERLITGVFYERRDSGDALRRVFFTTRVSPSHPETTLEELPVYMPAAPGSGSGSAPGDAPASSAGSVPSAPGPARRRRRTLTGFRQAWLTLRDRAPHLGVAVTDNQREWQEILEAARIDPELFSYQVQMNRREGGVDELFRFASAEDFADFLLQLALEPTMARQVRDNITAWRAELVRGREQLQPERELVAGMQDGLKRLREVSEDRARLRDGLHRIRAEVEQQTWRVDRHRSALAAEADEAEAQAARHAAAAEDGRKTAKRHRSRAAGLRLHAARLRVKTYRGELRGVEEQLQEQRRLLKIWTAAEPLLSAQRFEQSAAAHRRLLEDRQREHAPLLAQLKVAADRLAGALVFLTGEYRREADRLRKEAATQRAQALEYRRQAAEALGNVHRAEERAAGIERRLAEAEQLADELADRGHLQSGEGGEAALGRWEQALHNIETSITATQARIQSADEALEALERAIEAAAAAHTDCRACLQVLESDWRKAAAEREAVEADTVLQSILELETIDADQLSPQALDVLDRAANEERQAAVDARVSADHDRRALDYLAELGLLPPSADVRAALGVLRGRLAGQAWSGWEWLETNVPAADRAEVARRVPYLAQGIVVRAEDLERAAAILLEAGALPEGLLALTPAAPDEDRDRWPELPAVIVGPGEAALFDRGAGRAKAALLNQRMAQAAELIRAAEARHRDVVRARQALHRFRQRYPVGWFTDVAAELAAARHAEAEQARQLRDLRSERQGKLAERRTLEETRARLEREVRQVQAAVQALRSYVDNHVRRAAGWQAELASAQEEARTAAREADQWESMAVETDDLAEAHAVQSQSRGEAASRHEEELRRVTYVGRLPEPVRGPLDELRTEYETLRLSYEQRVGADQLSALAGQDERNAVEQRRRLGRLLSEQVTESVVQSHLDELADPDATDSLREQADGAVNTLFGTQGRLSQRVQGEEHTVRQAEQACKELGVDGPLERAPGSPELADGEANQLDEEARAADGAAAKSETAAGEASERARSLRERLDGLDVLRGRLSDLVEDYSDLFVDRSPSGVPGPGEVGPEEGLAGPQGSVEGTGVVVDEPLPALDAQAAGQFVRDAAGRLRRAREERGKLDERRQGLAAEIRGVAGSARAAVRDQAQWVDRVIAHPDSELEDGSARLSEQLALRRQVLDDQLAEIDKHRAVLANELVVVAEDGLRLLKQASALSRLPEEIAGIGGAQFLRITTDEADQPEERLARLAQLVDELARGDRELDGLKLAQNAVRRLARRIQVRVAHPDPAIRQSVSIPEMARFSGGEQLTGAILLYCTLASVRGRARGQSRRPSSVLVLDNPVGRASRPQLLRLQRDVARAMRVQLVYTTHVSDHEALSALPNVIRLRNQRVDRNSGRRLVEPVDPDGGETTVGLLEGVRIGRREQAATRASDAGARGSPEEKDDEPVEAAFVKPAVETADGAAKAAGVDGGRSDAGDRRPV